MMVSNSNTKIRYIPRKIEDKFEKFLKTDQIIAIFGPRRAGKTTLLFHYREKLSGVEYLSFEDQEVLDLFNHDIKSFAQMYLKGSKYLLLDEFHYAKQGGKKLKYLYDFYPNKKIVISGSSAPELSIKAAKYLTGMLIKLNLYPFSFFEYLKTLDNNLGELIEERKVKDLTSSPVQKQILSYFEKYLIYGGYPEIILSDDKDVKIALLKNIYNLLFMKEVKDFLTLAEDYKLKKLIQALSLQVGNLVQYQELTNISGLSFKTLKKYLNFLEKVFVCQLISPYYTNKRKELVKMPKVYFYDLGLLNSLVSNFQPLQKRVNKGSILENFVYTCLKKKSFEEKVNYWRTKSKVEVDFVLDFSGKVVPIEVKMGYKQNNLPSGLRSFIGQYNPKQAYVITFDFYGERQFEETKIVYLPAWSLEKFSLS